MCKCTPRDTKCTPSQSKSQFLGQFLLGGLDLEVGLYLDGLWGQRLKKVINFFGKKKCTPRQNPGYAYAMYTIHCSEWINRELSGSLDDTVVISSAPHFTCHSITSALLAPACLPISIAWFSFNHNILTYSIASLYGSQPVHKFTGKSRFFLDTPEHRRSQGGCSGCTDLHPPGQRKHFFRPNLQEKMCKCTPAGHEVHPQPEQESIFRSFYWVA